ncbi:hypothetical protein AURDEDRAFT_160943 [Auricularia subglabra TFB-10046 SS5]|nr:hypothetical protein AURDEDRAFT_160943 [Auricularia subglabra TFB-10046 SS5]
MTSTPFFVLWSEHKKLVYRWYPGDDKPCGIPRRAAPASDAHLRFAAALEPPPSRYTALSGLSAFGGSVAYSSYFQYSSDKQRDRLTMKSWLAVAFLIFLLSMTLTLCLQLLSHTLMRSRFKFIRHLPRYAEVVAASTAGIGSCTLAQAMILDYWYSGGPKSLTYLFTVLYLFFTFLPVAALTLPAPINALHGPTTLDEAASYVLAWPSRVLPNSFGSESHPSAATVEIVIERSDDARDAAFFLRTYLTCGGALKYVQHNVPAFAGRTVEDRAAIILQTLSAFCPSAGWIVVGSREDAQAMCQRFVELAMRWFDVAEELRARSAADFAGMPVERQVRCLLDLEKALRLDKAAQYATSSAPPDAPQIGCQGAGIPLQAAHAPERLRGMMAAREAGSTRDAVLPTSDGPASVALDGLESQAPAPHSSTALGVRVTEADDCVCGTSVSPACHGQ